MEQRKVLRWEIGEFIFLSILGTSLHFVYEWSQKNPVVAAFSPINESTWEHLKLLFYPVLLFTILESFVLIKSSREKSRKKREEIFCLWVVKGRAVLLGLLFIVIFFYTYSGVLGKNYAWLDIGSFYVSALLVCIASYRAYIRYLKQKICRCQWYLGIWFLFLICFVWFTYQPPKLGIFQPLACNHPQQKALLHQNQFQYS